MCTIKDSVDLYAEIFILIASNTEAWFGLVDHWVAETHGVVQCYSMTLWSNLAWYGLAWLGLARTGELVWYGDPPSFFPWRGLHLPSRYHWSLSSATKQQVEVKPGSCNWNNSLVERWWRASWWWWSQGLGWSGCCRWMFSGSSLQRPPLLKPFWFHTAQLHGGQHPVDSTMSLPTLSQFQFTANLINLLWVHHYLAPQSYLALFVLEVITKSEEENSFLIKSCCRVLTRNAQCDGGGGRWGVENVFLLIFSSKLKFSW